MGFLLKFAIFAVAGYVVWTSAKRMLGLSAASRRPVEPPPQQRSPAPQRTGQPVVEETRQCRVCGAFVAAGAGKCDRSGCPQPA
jgi:hypothetical protein